MKSPKSYLKSASLFFAGFAAAVALTLACAAGGAYAELIDNNNGTITDTSTRLVWLKNANCFGKQDWQTAMNSAAGLSSGACGLSDQSTAGQWRLPKKEELQARAASRAGFSNIQSSYYWSSSTYAYNTYYAWFAGMYNSLVDYGSKSYYYNVWPVRAGR